MSAPNWDEDYGDTTDGTPTATTPYEAFRRAYEVPIPGSAQIPPRTSFEMLMTEMDVLWLRGKYITVGRIEERSTDGKRVWAYCEHDNNLSWHNEGRCV